MLPAHGTIDNPGFSDGRYAGTFVYMTADHQPGLKRSDKATKIGTADMKAPQSGVQTAQRRRVNHQNGFAVDQRFDPAKQGGFVETYFGSEGNGDGAADAGNRNGMP